MVWCHRRATEEGAVLAKFRRRIAPFASPSADHARAVTAHDDAPHNRSRGSWAVPLVVAAGRLLAELQVWRRKRVPWLDAPCAVADTAAERVDHGATF